MTHQRIRGPTTCLGENPPVRRSARKAGSARKADLGRPSRAEARERVRPPRCSGKCRSQPDPDHRCSRSGSRCETAAGWLSDASSRCSRRASPISSWSICDNASDDGTVAAVEGYVRADSRVIPERQPGRTLASTRTCGGCSSRLAAGYFRWISADDWLEPGCLSACVQALESGPDAIGVTSAFTIHMDEGSTRFEEYQGEFPTSSDPVRRFERMLWFFQAGDAKYDPVYGVYRRRHIVESHRAATLGAGRLVPQCRTGAQGSDSQRPPATREPHARLPRRSRSGSAQVSPRSDQGGATANGPATPLSRALRPCRPGRPQRGTAASLQAGPAALLG